MSSYSGRRNNCLEQLKHIDPEDLQFLENDLCFYELVSLGFLLFGGERANAEFVLQKLLVLSTNATSVNMTSADLLRNYVSINPDNWRACLVEALAIIGARRVLRKLGFNWEELRQHYLPHITELSLNIHPLLKALYKLCERLTPPISGRLVLEINDKHKRPDEHLRFYQFEYLEVFLLDWITRRIISVGDHEMNGAEVQVLLDFFKLNEMDELKEMLVNTIISNAKNAELQTVTATKMNGIRQDNIGDCKTTVAVESPDMHNFINAKLASRTCDLDASECYNVRREYAGFILIINQKKFYAETDPTLQHLLPKKKLDERRGTDIDKNKLVEVFGTYGYEPQEYKDLTHYEMLHHIRETVKRTMLYDSLIVCILSHGIDGAVYGANSIPVQITEIENIIATDTLQGKPKFLIIQACQKEELETNIKKSTSATYLAPDSYADTIKAMSTVPGYASMRHTTTGTWFIQSLCDAVHKLGDKKHLLDILIAVTRDVSSKRGEKNEAMVPLTSHTLTKYFFLPRRA